MDKYSAAIITMSLIAGAGSAQPATQPGYHNGTGAPASAIVSPPPAPAQRPAMAPAPTAETTGRAKR